MAREYRPAFPPRVSLKESRRTGADDHYLLLYRVVPLMRCTAAAAYPVIYSVGRSRRSGTWRQNPIACARHGPAIATTGLLRERQTRE